MVMGGAHGPARAACGLLFHIRRKSNVHKAMDVGPMARKILRSHVNSVYAVQSAAAGIIFGLAALIFLPPSSGLIFPSIASATVSCLFFLAAWRYAVIRLVVNDCDFQIVNFFNSKILLASECSGAHVGIRGLVLVEQDGTRHQVEGVRTYWPYGRGKERVSRIAEWINAEVARMRAVHGEG